MSTVTWRRIVSAMLVLGTLCGCAMVFALYQINRTRPLPFAYTDITPIDAYPRRLCPGDALLFDLRITVNDAPSAVIVVENWQSAAGGAEPDYRPAYHIQEARKVAEVRQAVEVPALEPGRWTYERAGLVTTVEHPALLKIPFEVTEDCR